MSVPSHDISDRELAAKIDLTLLKPEASPIQIAELCTEARKRGFAAVCVNPVNVAFAALLLKDTPVLPITVVGFPLGTHLKELKAVEAGLAIRDGAKEIDMVARIDALKWNDDDAVRADIAAVADICRQFSVPLKVILETATLTEEEILRGCVLAEQAGAQFVKTSTGFHPSGGATIRAVQLMHHAVGGRLGIKASGGIKDCAAALAMLAAGATRIGASSGESIMKKD